MVDDIFDLNVDIKWKKSRNLKINCTNICSTILKRTEVIAEVLQANG